MVASASGSSTQLTLADTKQLVSEPLYFSSGDHELFAWLHRPAVLSPTSVGLVICKPFGYEALCTHRSLRVFADTAAQLGVPSLRFDYLGCGDSSDMDPGADQIQQWVADILAAVSELRHRTGVQQVCLLGVRLGALLATLAAARLTCVTSLILLAPVISGKRYLRELRTARLAANLGTDFQEAGHEGPEFEAGNAGSMEFSGYAMSAPAMESLSKIDLSQFPVPGVTRALVLDRQDVPVARTWYETLRDAGVSAQYLTLSGFVEMAMVAPQFSVVPMAMTEAIGDWLKHWVGNPEPRSEQFSAAPPPAVAAPKRELKLPADGSNDDGPSESPVSIGSGTALFGIMTQPSQEEVRRRGVILINAGADYHMGPSRMYVSLARRWARSGYYVLRLDLAGLGDSDTRAGEADDDTFPPAALDDIRDAVAYLRGRHDIREVTLMGLCSGAYHALRAAAAGLPMERVLLVNPQNYYWSENMTLDDLQLAEVVRNPGVYRERIHSASAWRRLFTGHVNVWRIFKIYAYRQMLVTEAALRNVARAMRIKIPNDLGRELEEIVGRGVQVTFIFAAGEPGIDLLKIQGGSAVKKLGENCRVRIIEHADHTFSRSGPRSAMERLLSDELIFWCTTATSVAPKAMQGIAESR
jgi:alpha-beta hydrolase superfamily lysophospholipase